MESFRDLLPELCGLPARSKPKTDEEIYAMAKREWLDTLCSLWIAIGKPVEPERLKIYSSALGDVPQGLLEKAISRVQNTSTYNIVPTIAAVRAAVMQELSEANCNTIAGWIENVWNEPAFLDVETR